MTASTELRCLCADDAASIAAYCDSYELSRMTSRIPYPYTVKMAEAFCADALEPGNCNWAITDGQNLIGAAGYRADGGVADIGYWIGAPFAGRGHATKAATLLSTEAFSDPQCVRLTACVFQDNPASARVLLKAGFIQQADCAGPCIARGPGTYPTWTFALERAAWEAAP